MAENVQKDGFALQLFNQFRDAMLGASPSIIRLGIIVVLAAGVLYLETTLRNGIVSVALPFVVMGLVVLTMLESGRFGFSATRKYGVVRTALMVVIGYGVMFSAIRYFREAGLEPDYRFAGWMFPLWLGFLLGVLAELLNRGEEG